MPRTRTTNQPPQERLQQVNEVYQIFKDFFGEEYTDLQKQETDTPEIYVWWPEVTVTNEHDRSVVIQDLYAKVPVTLQGMIPPEGHGFFLTRSSYNSKQWKAGYCHSHIPHFNAPSAPGFQRPCLGTGPIKHTITCLKTDNDLALWMMFCQELALYVTVESLTGVPYIKLETIGTSNRRRMIFQDYSYDYTELPRGLLEEFPEFEEMLIGFTAYYLEHGKLSFNFGDRHFVNGMPYYNFMIDISNCFIAWFNEHGNREESYKLFQHNILHKVQVANGVFYSNSSLASIDVEILASQRILIFKGQDIMLHVEQDDEAEEAPTLLVDHEIAMYILKNILKIVNYRYTNEHSNNSGTAGTQEASAPAYQTVIYL